MRQQSPPKPMIPRDRGTEVALNSTRVRCGFPDGQELPADSRRIGRIELIRKNNEQEQRDSFDAVPVRSV